MRNPLRSGVLVVLVALSSGCPHETPSEAPAIAEHEGLSEIAFQLPERDLIPEGICYDPEEDVFYLGSIRKSKILKISREGEVAVFVPPIEGEDRGYLGMRIDTNRRVLWANWHQEKTPGDPDPERQLWTGTAKFDLEDGRLIREYMVEKTDENHLFNDVAIARDGSVYFTSFAYGMIYTIDSVTDEIQEFLPMPEGVWNNGIDISPDDRYLFVVGNDKIFRVHLETKKFFELPIPENEIVGWGDGLYFYEGNLLAITTHREGDRLVHRVLKLHLSEMLDRITAIDVLDRDHPLYSNPTTGAVADDWFYYIATAQFEKFDEDGNLAPWDELSDTYVLKLRLE
jgi:DNA-binding beta-propeller fold protein YncE